ncbi:MAG: response regulator transcription factor [Anaerolineaceae bacterium]|nr:response regulator transcription factor [Anaerolineaceae bacterium]
MDQTGPRILVIDDERPIRRLLKTALTAHGYVISEASTGQEGLAAIAEDRPDLVILDLGLPDIDGVEVTGRVREWTNVPIIILSVRENETDKIKALDMGADDYLTKPFGIGELVARIRVCLRRSIQPNTEPIFQLGALKVDFVRRMVTLNDVETLLTPTEYELFRILVQNAGRVITHRQLLRQVWGAGYETETHILRVNISNLRRKIEPDPSQPSYILTEPGVGYRLKYDDQISKQSIAE